MSWIWSVVNIFFDGPQGLLYLHLFIFWSALYVWCKFYRDRVNYWVILVIGFLPWIINFSGVLWKDVGMAFALLLFAGLGVSGRNPISILLALMLLFYAINLRHNALFAVIPLVALVVVRWFPAAHRLKMGSIIFVTLFSMVALGNVLNYQVLESTKSKPSNYMMLDDLSYLSLISQRSLIPGIPFEDIIDCAAREVGQSKLIGRDFCLSKKESYQANSPFKIDLKTIWLTQVAQAPIDYANFRMAAFAYLLRSPSQLPYYIWHPGVDENKMGIKHEANRVTIFVERLVQKSSETVPFLFKPYWWLWFGLMLLLYTFSVNKGASVSMIRALLVSGIFYILGYIPATPMADFRYVYWSVIATTLAALLLFIERYSFARGQPRVNLSLGLIAILITAFLFNINKIFLVDLGGA